MGAGKNYDLLLGNRIEDAVWEAAHYDTPHARVNFWMLERISLDGRDRHVKGTQKFRGQASAARFVPLRGRGNFFFCLRSVNEPSAHAPKRA
jgi:hypothetical protein